MADAKSGRIVSTLKGWAYCVRQLRRTKSIAWIPAIAITIVVVIWTATIFRIHAERREAQEAASASTTELA